MVTSHQQGNGIPECDTLHTVTSPQVTPVGDFMATPVGVTDSMATPVGVTDSMDTDTRDDELEADEGTRPPHR